MFMSSPGKGKSPDADSGMAVNSTEDEQLQELGKPRLGDIIKIRINIKESQEFKVRFVLKLLGQLQVANAENTIVSIKKLKKHGVSLIQTHFF